jgi:hypothetical protein
MQRDLAGCGAVHGGAGGVNGACAMRVVCCGHRLGHAQAVELEGRAKVEGTAVSHAPLSEPTCTFRRRSYSCPRKKGMRRSSASAVCNDLLPCAWKGMTGSRPRRRKAPPSMFYFGRSPWGLSICVPPDPAPAPSDSPK